MCGDLFDPIGKIMLRRMYVCRSSVLNIDWNVFFLYYLKYYLYLDLKITFRRIQQSYTIECFTTKETF